MEVYLGKIPITANKMLRMHWAARRKEQALWRRSIFYSARYGPYHETWRKKEFLKEKARVTIQVRRKRPQDEDNAVASWKPILDALVKIGWLVDDSPEWCSLEGGETKAGKEAEGTTIRVEYGPF